MDESEDAGGERKKGKRRKGDRSRGPTSPTSGGEGSAASGDSVEGQGDGEDDDDEDEEGGSDSDYDDQDQMSGEEEGEQEGVSGSEESEGGADGEVVTPKSTLRAKAVDIEATYMNANGILVDAKQLEAERAYVQPTEVELKTKYKMMRMPIKNKMEGAQVLLLNYVESDYRHVLKKLLGLISIVPSGLKAIIVPLPKGATQPAP